MPAIIATHFNDPGCPWGYSFRPSHARLLWRFGDQIDWRLVLIGLSENADAYAERGFTPARMATGLPGFRERFGMPFASGVKPRVAATSRACRAVVAARRIDPSLADPALRALQFLHFTGPGMLDTDRDLRLALDAVPGLDAAAVVASIDDADVVADYQGDRALARSAAGSPTEAQGRSAATDGPVRYTAPSVVFEHRDGRRLEVGGFQPFDAYDTALANLDPRLARRPAPADAGAVLEEFPHGLTTAEVAAVLRPSDTDPADQAAAQAQLAALAGEGTAVCEPLAGDARWRLAAHAEASGLELLRRAA